MSVMKLNIDGSCNDYNDVGVGGITKDSKGDALLAELFGVYHGLDLIINKSISNVVCGIDTEEVV